MTKEQKFFICETCGNIIGMIEDKGVPVVCCGKKMTELVANTSDGAQEKHVPVVEVKDNLVYVSVGTVVHPMLEEHSIQWVYLRTNQGGHRKSLAPGSEPKVVFALTEGEEAIEVFEYCNLHGLWKTVL
ncbi:desulfoferrodoxin family protein [Lachnoclostridium phytofermentans]|uniref:Desulfoferrodoxin n=1 Tax=Lachnoclostridium phytofermentans (strain ATCC 700394 / DSM 18823 / ISDg) TaxID=357809 RepID=A9KHK8_LACP7|nr:desulfoferrodoxin family protein [Lachnoclostridium phytofermentans]ABX42293.1 Desulfoferrodoxin ferrous iron-binding region [Lachnoclostridium phytofermentans ISDg]